MDYFVELHGGLLLAEKLLKYSHLQGCFEICNDIEDIFIVMNNKKCAVNFEDILVKRLLQIQIKLNNAIVEKVRKATNHELSRHPIPKESLKTKKYLVGNQKHRPINARI